MLSTISNLKQIHFITYTLISHFMKFNFDLKPFNQKVIDTAINKCYNVGIPLLLNDYDFKDFIFDIRIDELDKWMVITTFIYNKHSEKLLLIVPILKCKWKIKNTFQFSTSYNK